MCKVHIATPDGQRGIGKKWKIHERFAVGTLPAGTLYWINGMTEWRPIEEVLARDPSDPSTASPRAEMGSDDPPPLPIRRRTSALALFAIALTGVACGAWLLVTTQIFLRQYPKVGHGPSILLGFVAAVLALVFGNRAMRRIANSEGRLRGEKLVVASRIVVVILFIGSPIVPILAPRPPHGSFRWTDAGNLRQIGQSSLIYANDHREFFPPARFAENGGQRTATLHDVARLLAEGGGLNDTSFWFLHKDKALSPEALKRPTIVFDRKKKQLHPAFAEQQVFSYDYVTGLKTSDPSSTPIAWTRGLRPDGTWDEDGVFGTAGGHIVFIGGNVSFYKNLKLDGNPRLLGRDGNPTVNILDTPPPGARIVGGGPASLNGYFKPDASAAPDPRRSRIAIPFQ